MRIAVLSAKRNEISHQYSKDWEGRDTNDDAESVIAALRELGHEPIAYPVDIGLFNRLRKDKDNIDIAFNLCDDGFFFNPELEPHLPAMLDILGITYTGSNYLSLALCLDKALAKNLLAYHDIPTPRFQVFRVGNELLNRTLKFPLIVKPVHEDASIGINDESVVRDEPGLRTRAKHVIAEYKQPALAEEFIDGREFNVGIIGDKEHEVLPVSEILFDGLPEDKPKIVNYAAKWKKDSIDYNSTQRSCPADIDEQLRKTLASLALKSSKLMLCRDYFRVDFRLDRENNPFVLEVNPNPDISEDAGLAAMAKAMGYSYKEIIGKIVESAVRRKHDNKK